MDAARKEKLGRKWACSSCGAKFYDLNRPEPACPKCGTVQGQPPPEPEKPKRARPKKTAKKAPPPPPPDDDRS